MGVRKVGSAVAVMTILASWVSSGFGDHIDDLDIGGVRTSLGATEGYLNFMTSGGHGAEYTGHTNNDFRDYSDNYFTVKPIVVSSNNGTPPNSAAAGNIANDFEFAQKTYAQAGLSVRLEATGNVTAAVNSPYTNAQLDAIAAQGRSGNADTINLYYVQEFNPATNNGSTVAPMSSAALMSSVVRDNRANNTVAHELGHMLLNGNALWSEHATASESSDTTNLMYVAGTQAAADLDDVGQMLSATVGGHDIIEHREGGANVSQIERMHGNLGANNPGFVKHQANVDTHGDKADFDWVSDHRLIEGIDGGGNGADANAGVDFLVWEINNAQVLSSQHQGPAADAHGAAPSPHPGEFDLEGFSEESFHYIDVVSNINLYADNDIDTDTLAVSNREKALDYILQVSIDGASWFEPTLLNVFVEGWTEASDVENYLARFHTSQDVKFARVQALGAGVVGHDGNTQIDAIIVAVPEPSSVVLALVAAVFSITCYRRTRTQ